MPYTKRQLQDAANKIRELFECCDRIANPRDIEIAAMRNFSSLLEWVLGWLAQAAEMARSEKDGEKEDAFLELRQCLFDLNRRRAGDVGRAGAAREEFIRAILEAKEKARTLGLLVDDRSVEYAGDWRSSLLRASRSRLGYSAPEPSGGGGLTESSRAREDENEPRRRSAEEKAQQDSPPPLVLQGQREPVFVRGKEKAPLTSARYDVVAALLEAGEAGLTKDELDKKSGHTDARKLLYDISKLDDDWAEVIQLPGKTGKRYRVRQV